MVCNRQRDVARLSVLAERVEDFVREGRGQSGLGEMIEGFLEAETVEEPNPIDECFVFWGKL